MMPGGGGSPDLPRSFFRGLIPLTSGKNPPRAPGHNQKGQELRKGQFFPHCKRSGCINELMKVRGFVIQIVLAAHPPPTPGWRLLVLHPASGRLIGPQLL